MKKTIFFSSVIFICFYSWSCGQQAADPLPTGDTLNIGDTLKTPEPEVFFGTSFLLKKLSSKPESGYVHLSFEFEGSDIPELKQTENFKNNRKVIKLEMKNTTLEDLSLPELPVPFSHFELVTSMEDKIPKLTAFLYLEQSLAVQLLSEGNVVTFKIESQEDSTANEPLVLEQVVYQAIDENTLFTKISFNQVPPVKGAFLVHESKNLVLYFYNTRLKDSLWEPPEMPGLLKFTGVQGETGKGVPYVKLIYHCRYIRDYNTREDENRFFIDLFLENKSQQDYSKSREHVYETIVQGSVVKKDTTRDETSYLALLKSEDPALYQEYVQKRKDNKKFIIFLLVFFVGTALMAYFAASI